MLFLFYRGNNQEERLSNLFKIKQNRRARIYTRQSGFRSCACKHHTLLPFSTNLGKVLEWSILKQSLLKRQIRFIFITQNKNILFSRLPSSSKKKSHRIKAAHQSAHSYSLFLSFLPQRSAEWPFYISPTCPFPTSQIYFILPWRPYVFLF